MKVFALKSYKLTVKILRLQRQSSRANKLSDAIIAYEKGRITQNKLISLYHEIVL